MSTRIAIHSLNQLKPYGEAVQTDTSKYQCNGVWKQNIETPKL